MGNIRTPLRVKLFFGMLSPEPGLFSKCSEIVRQEYGPLDLESDVLPWEITDYYRDEMAGPIFRKFIFLERLVDPGVLPEVKHFSNRIEDSHAAIASSRSRRKINIDPGYITEAKVVLATTKDFSHRVYIGGNMYAEVTLKYSSKERSFCSLDHTYFDFRTDTYQKLFNSARNKLREKLKC